MRFMFFDIDETLVDQSRAEATAAAAYLREFAALLPNLRSVTGFCRRWRALREKHLPAFLEGTIDYREHHRRRIRDLFVDGAGLSDAEAEARYAVFLEEYRRGWRLFDDVPACLDALAGRGLGVVSNGSSARQRLKLERTGILDRFSTVVVSEDAGAAKPGAAIFAAACRAARCAPDECVYVGDRIDADVFSSVRAGLRGVWLNRGGLPAPPNVETIGSLNELPELLERAGSRFPPPRPLNDPCRRERWRPERAAAGTNETLHQPT